MKLDVVIDDDLPENTALLSAGPKVEQNAVLFLDQNGCWHVKDLREIIDEYRKKEGSK